MHNNSKKTNKADQNKTLVKVRDRIDEIDLQVLTLLKERLNCAQEIGRLLTQADSNLD